MLMPRPMLMPRRMPMPRCMPMPRRMLMPRSRAMATLPRLSTVVRGRRCHVEYDLLAGRALLHDTSDEAPDGVAVLLHASGGSMRQWKHLASLVDDTRFAVVGINSFGAGRSTVPNGLDFADARLSDQVEAITETVHHLARGRPLRLIGHSYGGLLAASVAEACAARGHAIDALVLYEPNLVQLLTADWPPLPATRQAWAAAVERAMGGDFDETGRILWNFWNGEGAWDATPPDVRAKLVASLGRFGLEGTAVLGVGQGAVPMTPDVRFLRDGPRRKHLLHGTVQTASIITKLAEVLADEAGFAVHAVEGAGHMAPALEPERLSPVLLDCAGIAMK